MEDHPYLIIENKPNGRKQEFKMTNIHWGTVIDYRNYSLALCTSFDEQNIKKQNLHLENLWSFVYILIVQLSYDDILRIIPHFFIKIQFSPHLFRLILNYFFCSPSCIWHKVKFKATADLQLRRQTNILVMIKAVYRFRIKLSIYSCQVLPKLLIIVNYWNNIFSWI